MSRLLFLVFLMLSVFGSRLHAQFEGMMHYKVIYSDNQFSELSTFSPSALTYYFSKTAAKLIPESDSTSFAQTIYKYGTKKGDAELFLVSSDTKEVVSIMDFDAATEEHEFVEQVGAEETVEGYPCRKYVQNTSLGSVTIWMTEEIELDDRLRSFDGFLPVSGLGQLKGVPVKIEEVVPGSYTKTILLDQELKVAIASSEFQLPEGYELLEMSLVEYFNQ